LNVKCAGFSALPDKLIVEESVIDLREEAERQSAIH
jgi:hypothetical protein